MGNQLANALVEAGLAEPLKQKPQRKGKPVVCRKCGKHMTKITNTNMAVCENCKGSSYIVFNR